MAMLSVLSPNILEQNGPEKAIHENGGGTEQEVLLASLMEKLEMTSKQIKAWSETSRKLRAAMAKYTDTDPVDPGRLQKCLDNLKRAITVSSLPAMVERLESIAKPVNLNVATTPGGHIFISYEFFYVEVLMGENGKVTDVKVAHYGDPVSCPQMCEALKMNDFKEFAEHLKGLAELDQTGGDMTTKSKAFMSLQALETDLSTLSQLSNKSGETPLTHVKTGFVGHFTGRVGGHHTKLTFFVSPYDLLDLEQKQEKEIGPNESLPKDVGLWVTIALESSSLKKLQTLPLITVTPTEGKGPSTQCAQLTGQNSCMLPAVFSLTLNKPMPIPICLIRHLQSSPGVTVPNIDVTTAIPMMSLICQYTLDPDFQQNQTREAISRLQTFTFDVSLPDQKHRYFMNEPTGVAEMRSILVSKFHFTQASYAVQAIKCLRQQANYNALVASCVRKEEHDDCEEAMIFEVTAYTYQKMTVIFEHPAKDGMACVEFDMEGKEPNCKVYSRKGEDPFCTDEYATKVLRKCLSIPVTMRAILKKAEGWLETRKQKEVPAAANPSAGSLNSAGSSSTTGSGFSVMQRLSSSFSSPSSISTKNANKMAERRASSLARSCITDSNSLSSVFVQGAQTHASQGSEAHGLSNQVGYVDNSKVTQNPMLASLLQSTIQGGGPPARGNAPQAEPQQPLLAMHPHQAIAAQNKHTVKHPMLMDLLQQPDIEAVPPHVPSQVVPGKQKRGRKKGRPALDRTTRLHSDEDPNVSILDRSSSQDQFHFPINPLSSMPLLYDRPSVLPRQISLPANPSKLPIMSISEPQQPVPPLRELSQLIEKSSEVQRPPMKKGRRSDSASSNSGMGAPSQSPKTPSSSNPTTPTHIRPPRTPEHLPADTPLLSSVQALISELPPKPSIDQFTTIEHHPVLFSPENITNVPKTTTVLPAIELDPFDFNEDIIQKNVPDFDDMFNNKSDIEFELPAINSAIARMEASVTDVLEGEAEKKAGLEVSTPVSSLLPPRSHASEQLSNLLINDKAVDLSNSVGIKMEPNISERESHPAGMLLSGSHNSGNRKGNIKQSKGKPRNFARAEGGMTPPPESTPPKMKRRSKKVVKETTGAGSEVPMPKPRGKRGRKKKKEVRTSDSDSSPDCSREDYQMTVSSEQPLKMIIKMKPSLEQKKIKAAPSAPKIKLKVPVMMPAVESGSSEEDSETPAPTPTPIPTLTPKDEVKNFLLKEESMISASVSKVSSNSRDFEDHKKEKSEKLSQDKFSKKEMGHMKSEAGERSSSKRDTDITKAVEKLKSLDSKGRAEDRPFSKSSFVAKQSSHGINKGNMRTDITGRRLSQVSGVKPKVSVKPNPESILQGVLSRRPVDSLPRIPKLSKTATQKDSIPKVGTGGDGKSPIPLESPKKNPVLGSAFHKTGPGQDCKMTANKKSFNPTAQRQRSVSPSVRLVSEKKGNQRSSVFTKPSQKGSVSPRGNGNQQGGFNTGGRRSPSVGERRGVDRRAGSASPSGSSPSCKVSGASPSRPGFSPNHPSKGGFSSGSSPGSKYLAGSSPNHPSKMTSSPSHTQKNVVVSSVQHSKTSQGNKSVSGVPNQLPSLNILSSARTSTLSPTLKTTTTSSSATVTSVSVGPRIKSPIKVHRKGSLSAIVNKLNERVQGKEKTQDSVAGQKVEGGTSEYVEDKAEADDGQKTEREGIFEGISAASQIHSGDDDKSDEVLNVLFEKGFIEKAVHKNTTTSLFTGAAAPSKVINIPTKASNDEDRSMLNEKLLQSKDNQNEVVRDLSKSIPTQAKLGQAQIRVSTMETGKRSPSPKTTSSAGLKQSLPSKSVAQTSKAASSPKSSQNSQKPSTSKSGNVASPSKINPVVKPVMSKSTSVNLAKQLTSQDKNFVAAAGVVSSEKPSLNLKPQVTMASKSQQVSSQVKNLPSSGQSPVSNRPIILSKSSSMMTSPDKGATKVTRVQIAPAVGQMKARPPTPTSGSIKKRAPVIYERNQSTDSTSKERKLKPPSSKQQAEDVKAIKEGTASTKPDANKVVSKGDVEVKKSNKMSGNENTKTGKMADKEQENQIELVKAQASLTQKLAALKRTATHDSGDDVPRKVQKTNKSDSKNASKLTNTAVAKSPLLSPKPSTSQSVSKPIQQPLKVNTVLPKSNQGTKQSHSPQGAKVVSPPPAKPKPSQSPQVAKARVPSPLPKHDQAEFKVPSPAVIPSSPRTLQNLSSPSQPSVKPSSPPKALSPISPGVPSPGGAGGVPSPQTHKRAATPEESAVPAKRSKILESCSPVSPAGSDDDGLLIDVPHSPNLKKGPPSISSIPGQGIEAEGTSVKEAAVPSPIPPQSPVGAGKSPTDGSFGSPSPCGIDDDLMNEALSSVRRKIDCMVAII